MATIRRRGGLFVAAAAICVVLMSGTTFVEAESLRGGHRSLISNDNDNNNHYAQAIEGTRRRAEGEGGEGGEGGQQGNNGQEGGQQQEQQQQQQQQGNNNEGEQQQQQNENKNEKEGEQQQDQQQQQEEQNNEQNAENEEPEEGEVDGYEEEANDDEHSGFSIQDTVSGVQDNINGLVDRFDQDLGNIWSSSPSEWDEELWTVFAVVAGTFTILLSCILCLLCACCNDTDDARFVAGTDKRPQRTKNHRGRLFTRMRDNDAETVASQQTGITEADDKPFHLIEDVEIKSRMGPTSVYANGEVPISPMSSKTGRLERGVAASPKNQAPTDDDDERTKYTEYTRASKKSKKGIFNETVDVWSEFLGFKKVKSYNTALFMKHRREADEDDYIDETDDELTRMTRRSKNSTRTSRGRQMDAGTYVAPKQGDSSAKKAAENARLSAPTPVMSNVMNQSTDASSPRRAALVKTRNLLKTIGKSKIGKSSSVDSKGEAPLTTKGSGNIKMITSTSSSKSA